jgi:HEAT repeat protein
MATPQNSPASALLERALTLSRNDPGSDERWDVVHELLRRGDVETFETAKEWCDSVDVTERELAADLLGQLGEIKQGNGRQFFPFTDQSIPLLEKLIDDSEARVIASAVTSMGKHYLYDPITARPSLVTHSSKEVRWAVAYSLSSANSKAAIDSLIKLSGDEADDVRDWATFGLGTQCSFDTPAIREALFNRLDDRHFETRGEALVGLARRKDARVIPHIKNALEADSVGMLAVEAAGHIGSSDLVEPLVELCTWWDVETRLLESALRSCKGEADPNGGWPWVQEDEIVVPSWAEERTKR